MKRFGVRVLLLFKGVHVRDEAEALVDDVLDRGDLQDAVNELASDHDLDVVVTSATCTEVEVDDELAMVDRVRGELALETYEKATRAVLGETFERGEETPSPIDVAALLAGALRTRDATVRAKLEDVRSLLHDASVKVAGDDGADQITDALNAVCDILGR